MTEKKELEDTINLNQLSYEEEEVYSQHLNTQIQVANTEIHSQEQATREETYEEKLTLLQLMPLTKRFHRNLLFTIRAALNSDLLIPFVELDQAASQRAGPKAVIHNRHSKSKKAARFFNTFYTQIGSQAFNNLKPDIRKNFSNPETFKTKVDFTIKEINVLSNATPLQRLSLLNQIKPYNFQYHRNFEAA